MSDLKNSTAESLRELNKLHNSLPAGHEKKNEVYEKILDFANQEKAIRDATLDQRMDEYKEATKAVEEANKAIKEAQENISKVADTINKVAKAVDLIGKLLIAIGLGG